MGKGEVVKGSGFKKGGGFQKNVKKVVKKNISKKDAEKQLRMKRSHKLEKVKERKAHQEKELQLKKAEKLAARGKLRKKDGSDDEWEDVVDEHEKDVFEKDGYFDVPETDKNTISKNDEKLLQALNQKKPEAKKKNQEEAGQGLNLADLIMQKLQTGQF